MRPMAIVWFSVIVLVAVQGVFGNNCVGVHNVFSCDECIRCGGSWCNDLKSKHCAFSIEDGWCPENQESLFEIHDHSKPGDLITPIYAERTLNINVPNNLDIQYTARTQQKAVVSVVNSTQSMNIDIREIVKCSGLNCVLTIEATPNTNFCNATGKTEEFVYVKVNVGGLDEAVELKYHVPCACECSQKIERNSKQCNGHGNFSCGICSCHPEWFGDDCSKSLYPSKPLYPSEPLPPSKPLYPSKSSPPSKPFYPSEPLHPSESTPSKGGNTPECPEKRGDVQCTSPINDKECSGNGYCGPCDSCICYKDREGSQYFEKDNFCTDLCMVTSNCGDCLANNTLGRCDSCMISSMFDMILERYNASMMDERDEHNKKVWVKCSETIDDCLIRYVAKRDEKDDIIVMVVKSCNDVIAAPVTAAPEVPIILGVVGIVAAIAAVAGIMIWKHMNALPPAPLNNPGYENIDAEDCTGENPLYKPPTSSFKNPMYGNKW